MSHRCITLPLAPNALYKQMFKVWGDSQDKKFLDCWDPSSLHTSSLLSSHHPPSSSLVGGTGGITSSCWRKFSREASWNLAKHSSPSAAGLIFFPLMEIKCLNLFVFPPFSVLLCALG